MKQSLQQKNTRSLLTWLPVVMLLGSVFFYLILMGHIRHMKQQQLQLKQDNVWKAYTGDTLHFPKTVKGEFEIVPSITKSSFTSDSADLSYLTQSHYLNGRSYLVTTRISAKEFNHLLVKAGLAEAFIFALLLAAIVVINRRTSARLWSPFYSTMDNIRHYDIRQNKSIQFDPATGIEEFDRLNTTLLDLIDHVGQAYRNQRQFTENASHELQTPLSIIRSKVELLIDSPGLNEDSANLLQEITEANERLSQMNKNLLLLTRIENAQFPGASPVDLTRLIGHLLHFFQEYYESKVDTIITDIQSGVQITANPHLIEIMVNNLLRNAFIHNIPGGWIEIKLTCTTLTISNTGQPLDTDPAQLFDRFRKGRVDNTTTGLGLALVRQIAQIYQFRVEYTCQDTIHRLELSFM